jgi:hypothetical protein
MSFRGVLTHRPGLIQNAEGELLLKRRSKAYKSPSTAFDISRMGKYLGIGSSEGTKSIVRLMVAAQQKHAGFGNLAAAWSDACFAAHIGDAAVFSTATLLPVRCMRASHMVFATAVAFDPQETALLSVSADSSAVLMLLTPQRRGPSLATVLLLLLLVAALVLLGVWYLGLVDRLLAALERLGLQPGKHTEL